MTNERPSMNPIETYRSSVPMWEQDENGHWSAQFYTRSFQYAAETLAVVAGGGNPGTESTVLRHMRYFRELKGGESLRILSGRLPSAFAPHQVFHVMRHGVTDELCAAAFETAGFDLARLAVDTDPALDRIGPRGVKAAFHDPVDSEPLLAGGRALVSHLSIPRPDEFDHTGDLLAHAIHARVGQAVPHLWVHVDAPWERFFADGFGRALVELLITRHRPCRAGDPLRMVSWFEDVTERAFLMRHQLEHMMTGLPVAGISTVSLLFDTKARRSVPVPPLLRDAFAKHYGD